jgi:hypothetical protein
MKSVYIVIVLLLFLIGFVVLRDFQLESQLATMNNTLNKFENSNPSVVSYVWTSEPYGADHYLVHVNGTAFNGGLQEAIDVEIQITVYDESYHQINNPEASQWNIGDILGFRFTTFSDLTTVCNSTPSSVLVQVSSFR